MVFNKNIDTSPFINGGSKGQIEAIRVRNIEIIELRELVDCLTKENIKLKDELKVNNIKW